MRTFSFNTIATRLALTIVLAMILGVGLEMLVGFARAYLASASSANAIVSRSGVFVFNGVHKPRFVVNLSGDPDLLMHIGRIVAAASFVDSTPGGSDRTRIVSTLSRPDFLMSVRDAPLRRPGDSDSGRLGFLRKLIALQIGVPEDRVVVQKAAAPGGGTALAVQVGLRDGHWLHITYPNDTPKHASALPLVAALIPLLALVGLLSVWTARRLAGPIERFSLAAERLGVDASAPPLPESGPDELRAAIRTFNRMQERLKRFVEDRTQMLAAMSHDLRTPLNRLRLRAEFIEDDEQQLKMFAELEAMNVMIDSTLAFVRDDAAREPRRLVDLGILVGDVCEDAVDAGGRVSYSGAGDVFVHCRPIAIARAVANLIDNAVKYGEVARVRLLHALGHVVIEVEDEGPGIPLEEQEKVFAPFYRLEQSRNAATGGVGLGLSAARTIVREHGGDISLANRDRGGLCARMELPS